MSEDKSEVIDIKITQEIVKLENESIVETNVTSEIKQDLSINPKTLVQCLLLMINQTDIERKSVKINKNLIDILKIFMEKTPKIFDEVEENMRNIMSDGVINSKDVPDIMLLISNVYELVNNLKQIKMNRQDVADTCASIIKIILHILIEEDIIKVKEENQIPILEQLDRLVDMSMRLVLLSYKAGSCGCFGNLFKKNKK